VLYRARSVLTRIRELFRPRSRSAAEQNEEFSFHIDMETAKNIRDGMSDVEARRAAVLRFGGTQRFCEETSDARGVVALDNLARDTRFAFRRLHHAPGFAAGVIATLGIGIGTAAGIGTMVYGVLLRDLPYANPDRLVRVGYHDVVSQGDLHPATTYFHFAKDARSFIELGAYSTSDAFNVTDGDAAERVNVAMMTPNMFTLLGVHPLLGQLFEPGDTSWSNPRSAIMLSENFWRRRYGGDSSIIGRRIDINRGARNVVGVLPRSFDFPTASIDVYYPTVVPVNRPSLTARGYHVIGRLRDDIDPAGAASELRGLLETLPERFPAITPEMLRQSEARASVQSLKGATVAPVKSQLVLLGVLVAVVLLIATTNVVNLFLLRTERAAQEIAIALSLGATRLALAQRFVMEGLVLGLASAIVALPAAALALSTKFGFSEREIPRLHEVAFTAETFALVLGSSALLGAAVGLIALTRTGVVGLFDRLRSSRSTASRAWRRAQNGLVAFQVAIALVLLVSAGLLGRSFWNLRTAQIGFVPGNAMTFEVSLPWDGYTTYAANAAFHASLMDRLAALPGVTQVGAARYLPLTSRSTSRPEYQLQAGDAGDRAAIMAPGIPASADYFRVMGIPLRGGRSFRAGDLRGSPAIVVSERLATMLFGTSDVVGRRVSRGISGETSSIAFTVVGVVGDVHGSRIEDGHIPMAYFPLLRDGDGLPADSVPVSVPREVQYAIRGSQLPTVSTVQAIVRELDRRVPATGIRTLGSLVDDATARVRLTLLLIGVAGVAALLLGVIGVYSVVAYAANGRVREFGIRLALGAAPQRVGGMVFGDGVRLVAIGTVAGLIAALAATRLLRALLYEVEPTSVAEFGIATTVLVVVTLCATLLPARRAARTHPGVVLRGE
jgi:putative ABC transport system permease protein